MHTCQVSRSTWIMSPVSHSSTMVLLPFNSLQTLPSKPQGPHSRRPVMQPSSNSRQILLQDVAGKRPPYELTCHATIYLVSSLKAWLKPAHKHFIYSRFHWHYSLYLHCNRSQKTQSDPENFEYRMNECNNTCNSAFTDNTFAMKDVIRSLAFTIYTWD